ncbi:hypothetical protein SAMN05216167_11265 [Spirosoma endophyticum]|uniref:Uncharacterized protein n=1 Tax=Spirosoma endophyticum TaxID=662367 RepID=A0A1I1ZAB6_9BACT|nr:hypothetical protein SAMN05216167_11265 [Spirosoma endophyticum]
MLIDPITHDDWVVNGWKIYCSLPDKLQIQNDHQSVAKNGYKDEAVKNEWVDRLSR